MFEKILLAYDGSDHSKRAADYALKLSSMNNAPVEIVHVRSLFVGYSPYMNISDEPQINKILQEDAERIIEQAVVKFKEAGVKFAAKIMTGDPADIICKEAEKSNVDVIVIGSRGYNPVNRYVLGSVSFKVLTYAHCPVLVVR